jgi:cobalt-zinc-cadmium efflux system outer membrane protein
MDRALRVLIRLAMVGLALTGPRSLHAQTRRDSFVNPSPTGPQGIVGGPPGPSVGRTQPRFGVLPSIEFGASDPSKMIVPPGRSPQDLPLPVPLDERPRRGVPRPEPMIGPTGGLTLDEAIEVLLQKSLELQQNRGDISQAEADLITAGLRANPIAYVDTLGVPYGSYTNKTNGGPTQSDFNIVHPLDLSHKRQARMKSAWLTRRAVEEKYKDIVRLAIDNLCTSFIDALLAQRNVNFKGENEAKAVRDVLAAIEYEDAKEIYEEALRSLSLQLNLPLEVLLNRGLRGRLQFSPGDEPRLPAEDDLVALARRNRPDLIAQRIIVARSDADIALARASRFDDVQLLYQPYTFYRGQASSGTPQNSLAWSLGVTVPLPIYNRQQGNIEKAHVIASQARTQLAILEKLVEADVRRAYRQHQVAENAVSRAEEATIGNPPLTAIERLKARYKGKDEDLSDLLIGLETIIKDRDDDKLKEFDAKDIQHRRSMLKLNTAIGRRIFP